MNDQDNAKEEIVNELRELQQTYNSLKATFETDMFGMILRIFIITPPKNGNTNLKGGLRNMRIQLISQTLKNTIIMSSKAKLAQKPNHTPLHKHIWQVKKEHESIKT